MGLLLAAFVLLVVLTLFQMSRGGSTRRVVGYAANGAVGTLALLLLSSVGGPEYAWGAQLALWMMVAGLSIGLAVVGLARAVGALRRPA